MPKEITSPINFHKKLLALMPTYSNISLNAFREAFQKIFNEYQEIDYLETFREKGLQATKAHIQKIVAEQNIDVVFVILFATSYELDPYFFQSLGKKTKIVFWFYDDENYFYSHSRYFAQPAHGVMTMDPNSVSRYKAMGIPSAFFAPICDAKLFLPVKTDFRHDVSFVGDCTKPARKNYVSFLKRNGISVTTFGKGSDNGFVDSHDLANIFSQSRINLNFTGINAPSWLNSEDKGLHKIRQMKGRPFEVASSCGFCLTENAPLLDELFVADEEMAFFSCEEELLNKIRFYLKDSEARTRIAKNGHAAIQRDFIPQFYLAKQIDELFIQMDKVTPCSDRPKINLSRSFYSRLVNSQTFAAFVLLKNARAKEAFGLMSQLPSYGMSSFVSGTVGGITRISKLMWDRVTKKNKI